MAVAATVVDAPQPCRDGGVVIGRASTDEVLKENLAITGAKSLFDALKKQVGVSLKKQVEATRRDLQRALKIRLMVMIRLRR